MTKIHLVLPDAHAKPGTDNERATLVGKLILDVRPDVVIDLGDSADFESLSSYDKGKRSFVGRSYRADVDSYLDFQDRLWSPMRRAKKRLPYSIRLIGNHEQRIDRALDASPELVNTISYSDLCLEDYYDTVIHYNGNTPGVIEVDGVLYSHYFTSGIMGRPIAGEHPAYSLVTKKLSSCTCGHSHIFDYCVRTGKDTKIMGLTAGCLVDYDTGWAGEVQKLWNTGVVVKRNVEGGQYDLEWISLERLAREYGN